MRVNLAKINRIVGSNIRHYRRVRGLSQQRLAAKIGVSFQQLQKYEAGTNRISAVRLRLLSQILQVSLYAFFRQQEDLRAAGETSSSNFQTVEND